MIKGHEIVKFEERPVARALDMAALVEDFLKAQDVQEISKKMYRVGVKTFLAWLSREGVDHPNRNDMLRFRDHLKGLNLAPNSINCYLTATKRFFAYLEGEGSYRDITRNVKSVKQSKAHHLRESLTENQVRQILESIDRSSLLGKRNYAMVLLMASTGLRTCSVVQADLGDLRSNGREAELKYKNKGAEDKGEAVLIVEHVLKPITAYLKARRKTRADTPLFTSHSENGTNGRLTTKTIRHIVKDLLRKNGIDDPRLSAHSLRHTFATISLQNGATLLDVSKALAHSSITTTMIYVHQIDRMGSSAAERFVDFMPQEARA
ncbi:Tyrosine recombinase XerD [subsurface metagenome]